MIRFMAVAGVFALLIGVGGCSASADDLHKKSIDKMNDLADAVEKKDEEKAKSIAKELKEIGDKLKDMKVPDDEKKKIEEKYKDDMTKAREKLQAAGMKSPELMLKIAADLAK